MPLETLRPDARTNVKRTTVETPEENQEWIFDAQKDLGEKGRIGIERFVPETLDEIDRKTGAARIAIKLKMLFPKHYKYIEGDEDIEDIKEGLDACMAKTWGWPGVDRIEMEYAYRTFYPKEFPEQIDSDPKELLRKIEESQNKATEIMVLLEKLAIFHPDEFNSFKIDDELANKIKKVAEIWIKEFLKREEWSEFLVVLVKWKLFFPEDKSLIEKYYNKDVQEKIRAEFHKSVLEYNVLSSIALRLKMLQAKEIIFSDSGMQIIDSPKIVRHESIPDIPNKKNF